MRRLLGYVLLTGLAPMALAQDLPTPRPAASSGQVISRLTGEVVRFVAEPQFRALVLGQDLLGGDLVQTGARGALGILFVDRTVLRLHPNSELLVRSVQPGMAALELSRGTLWARAPRGEANLTVTTPTAAAGIRGTDWALTVDGDGTTRLSVYDGAVELANAFGAVLTLAGEAAVAAPGRAPVKVGVANRREAPQMLYTIGPADAADLLATTAEELAADARDPPAAVALYREGVALLRSGEAARAADAFGRAAPQLGRERGAAARWLAAFARLGAGGDYRPPAAGIADADAVGAAFAAALAGDLDQAQQALATVAGAPSVTAAAVQLAILRDDAPLARRLVADLRRDAPGSVAALEAEAALLVDVEGDPLEAVTLLRRAVVLAPERAGLWNALGLAESAIDHPREAEAALRRAMALDPAGGAAAGNLAILLLDQERIDEARVLADQMLQRDPSSYLGLRAKGRAAVQSGDKDAEQLLLQALAAQPAAAETSIALAIAAQQSGDPTRAAQELDAAGRLDPNDAIVPLIRSITALDAGQADAAIAAARQAADLMRRQQRGPRAVAAERQSGAPLAAAYSASGLDGWARYAADRSYDPLSASSLFGEAFLRRLSVGRAGPSADGQDSAAVQGLLMEPLAASSRLRNTDILRRPFFDAELQFNVPTDTAPARAAALQVEGLARLPLPLAYSLTLNGIEQDVAGPFDLDRNSNGSLLLGTAFGATGGAFAVFGRSVDETHSESPPVFGLVEFDDLRTDNRSMSLGAQWRLDGRRFLTAFAGRSRQRSDESTRRFFTSPESVFQLDIQARQQASADTLSLGYRSEDDSGFWSAGAEVARVGDSTTGATVFTDLLTGEVTTEFLTDSTATRSGRLYLGRRQRLSADLLAEGLATADFFADSGMRPGGRLGFAWSPAPGHWLRAAVVADGNPAGSSLAPATTLGLLPLGLPYRPDGRMSGVLLRYDAELSPRVLFGIEHQSLRLSHLTYATDDPLASLDPDRASLDVTSARLDWWVGEGVGVFADVTHADSRIRSGSLAGAPLPETPEWTAKLGVGWLRPSQFSGQVQAVWTSERFSGDPAAPLDPVLTVDAGLRWQPLGKSFDLRCDVTNIFNTPVQQPWGQRDSGIALQLSIGARF